MAVYDFFRADNRRGKYYSMTTYGCIKNITRAFVVFALFIKYRLKGFNAGYYFINHKHFSVVGGRRHWEDVPCLSRVTLSHVLSWCSSQSATQSPGSASMERSMRPCLSLSLLSPLPSDLSLANLLESLESFYKHYNHNNYVLQIYKRSHCVFSYFIEAAILDRNLKLSVIFCLVLNFIRAETMEA